MSMKIIQEFSDDPETLMASCDHPVKRIEKLPLPYTGNKKKLCHQIQDAILKHGLQFDTVLDAFTGSATVAFLFKLMGKRVIANDLLTNSYINAVAFVENDSIKLTKEEQQYLLCHENPNKGTFVEDNYLGISFRPSGKDCRFNKFTLKECRYLDNFRANIDDLCLIQSQSMGITANAAVVLRLPFGNVDASHDIMYHRLKQQERHGIQGTHYKDKRIGIYYDEEMNLKFHKWFPKYVGDFATGISSSPDGTDLKIKRATFLANLQQHVLRDCMVQGRLHHGQSLAELKTRLDHPKNQLKGQWDRDGNTEMDFFTQAGKPGQGMKWWTFADIKLPGSCIATNMDVIELLKTGFCKVDCAYFDPPYGGQSSDYATIYRFLEEYIYSEPLEKLPHIQKYGRRFVNKKSYEQNFLEMLQQSKHIPIWLFSYNDTSWKNIDYISELIKGFGRKVIIETLSQKYRYLYRKKQGRDTLSKEYLIIALN